MQAPHSSTDTDSVNASRKARHPAEVMRFTKDRLDALPARPERYEVLDKDTPGLRLRISPTGVKSFCFFRWVPVTGRPERVTFGKYTGKTGGMSIKAAQDRAKDVQGTIHENKSPANERNQYRDSDTFEDAFDKWMTNHVRVHLVQKTAKDFQAVYDLYIKPSPLKAKRLVDIRHADIEALHARVGKTLGKPTTANKIAGIVRAVYRHVAKHTSTPLAIPTFGLKKFNTPGRERFLNDDEIVRFVAALGDTPQPYRDLFRMLMLTGVRLNNMLAAEFNQFDVTNALWTIRGSQHKNKRQHSMPLVPEAVEIVQRRRAAVPNECTWLWPTVGKRESKSGHITHVGEPWADLLARAEITDLRRHDLRHTLASWMAMSGEGLPMIGKQLGHVSMQSTQKYAHLATGANRTALESTLAKMAAAAKPPPKAKRPHS